MVQRIADGQALASRGTIAERERVVRLLNGKGMNDQQIARRTGMSPWTALRIRQRLNIPPAPDVAKRGPRRTGVA
jgi:transposase